MSTAYNPNKKVELSLLPLVMAISAKGDNLAASLVQIKHDFVANFIQMDFDENILPSIFKPAMKTGMARLLLKYWP